MPLIYIKLRRQAIQKVFVSSETSKMSSNLHFITPIMQPPTALVVLLSMHQWIELVKKCLINKDCSKRCLRCYTTKRRNTYTFLPEVRLPCSYIGISFYIEQDLHMQSICGSLFWLHVVSLRVSESNKHPTVPMLVTPVFLLPLTHGVQGSEPCEVRDPQQVWA